MSEHENLVVEETAENVEHTTEETAKTYTEAEFNAKLDEVLGKKIARKEAKIRKEYERKYGNLEEVLKAGTGKESVEEMTNTFAEFYRQKGITIPEKPTYSTKDIEVLARAEAEDIIRSGYDEVVEEVDRLTDIGVGNMTAREKAVFKVLAEHRQSAERSKELTKLGVTEDVFNSQEFKEFAGKFNATKKEIKTMGSMKTTSSADNGVKDFYTRDEALKFSKKDFDENPALFAAVVKSSQSGKW